MIYAKWAMPSSLQIFAVTVATCADKATRALCFVMNARRNHVATLVATKTTHKGGASAELAWTKSSGRTTTMLHSWGALQPSVKEVNHRREGASGTAHATKDPNALKRLHSMMLLMTHMLDTTNGKKSTCVSREAKLIKWSG